jgi:hypothetical protein
MATNQLYFVGYKAQRQLHHPRRLWRMLGLLTAEGNTLAELFKVQGRTNANIRAELADLVALLPQDILAYNEDLHNLLMA